MENSFVDHRFDAAEIDLEGFMRELRALRKEIDASLGEADLDHLKRMERWGRMFSAAGALTAGIAPNPLSAVALAVGRASRWMLMHHVGHCGYDRVPGVPAKYTSKVFARGSRRYLDWPDWMVPEAWIHEHNVLHHSYTGEDADPDLVERNTEIFEEYGLPKAARYAFAAFFAATWRATYYAPNTMRELAKKGKKPGEVAESKLPLAIAALGDPEMWRKCYAPYIALEFVAFPLAYSFLGPWSVFSAWCNSVGAEVIVNLHTFCVIGPNHSGEDLYRFDSRPATRAESYLRQVIGSVNYAVGTDVVDFAHLWLNYQIEHHIWPDLPMLKYQQFQPRVKALCAKYGVPYAQEGVLKRVAKMVDIFVGNTKMRKLSNLTRKGAPKPERDVVIDGIYGSEPQAMPA